jgi:hypothetical protein
LEMEEDVLSLSSFTSQRPCNIEKPQCCFSLQEICYLALKNTPYFESEECQKFLIALSDENKTKWMWVEEKITLSWVWEGRWVFDNWWTQEQEDEQRKRKETLGEIRDRRKQEKVVRFQWFRKPNNKEKRQKVK